MDQSPPPSLLNDLSRKVGSLSPAHRKIATYVLEYPFRAATMGIEDLAAAAGVSVATANRFAHALGFGGYPAFRSRLLGLFNKTIAPIEKLRASQKHPSEEVLPVLRGSLETVGRDLERAAALLGEASCARAVAMILEAGRVVTLGFGVSAATARLVADLFAPYCSAIEIMDGTGGPERMVRRAMRFGPADLVVGVTVPRYSRATVELLREARRRGAKVLGLTDAPLSPIVPECDVALFGPAEHNVLHSSVVAIVALAEGLTAALACRRETVSDATDLTERMLPFLLVDEAAAKGAKE